MARILLDEGLPVRAAGVLRDRRLDAVHAREVGLASADDASILEYAREHGHACITLDHDFHRLLADSGAAGPSTILIRAQGLSHVEAADWVEKLVRQLRGEIEAGSAVTATKRGVRLRRLPLG